MAAARLDVLYEDNHLLAVNKPPGLPTMGVAPDAASVVQLAKRYLKQKYQKPGNVYLGVVSRLDALASGVVLFARTSKAAARLTEQFRSRRVEKTYWAIVSGSIEPAAGEWTDWIVKDESRQRMVLAERHAPGAKEARLKYRRRVALDAASLLEIELETGRKHQIRLQLSAHGFPIVGDRKYGSRLAFVGSPRQGSGSREEAIALHSRRLLLTHPVRGEEVELIAPLPGLWQAWGVTDLR